jgi:transglutaminase-like putative cysteine protease
MTLSVGCTLGYQVLATPSAAFTLNVLANSDTQQRVLRETIVTTPAVATEIVPDASGGRTLRCDALTGTFEFRYQAAIEVQRPPLPAAVPAELPGRLALPILALTQPSRYCESDRFARIAWELFGTHLDRAEQVRAVCAWVDANIAYTPNATDGRTSAWDVWIGRKGVCRDYTHLAIAFCRALSIPARYVSCYAAGLEPMDFHACFEVWLGGEWRLFDPTDNIAPENIAVIARGQDAGSAALTTIFGRTNVSPVKVTCTVAA